MNGTGPFALNKHGDIVSGCRVVTPLLLSVYPQLPWQRISRALRLSRGRPLRQARGSAGSTPRAPLLVRLRPAARPLAEWRHTSPHTPLGQMGVVGADLRGRLEEDPACEEGAGVGAGTRVWVTAGPRGTERRRPGTGVPGLWDGDGEPELGLRDPGMQTQVCD